MLHILFNGLLAVSCIANAASEAYDDLLCVDRSTNEMFIIQSLDHLVQSLEGVRAMGITTEVTYEEIK